MTITPRGTGGTATTRTARNRNRRRQQNVAGEPRHAAPGQPELAPPRRRGGRHAAEDPLLPDAAGAPDPAAEADFAGATDVSDSADASSTADVSGPAIDDVEFPAPAWDPWATTIRQTLPAAGDDEPLNESGDEAESPAWNPWATSTRPALPASDRGDGPLDVPGAAGHRGFWAAPEDREPVAEWDADTDKPPAMSWVGDSGTATKPVAGWSGSKKAAAGGWAGPDDAGGGWAGGAGADRHGWADATGSWVGTGGVVREDTDGRAASAGWADEPTGWSDAGRAHPSSWTDHTGMTALPTASRAGTGTDRRTGGDAGHDFADTGIWPRTVTDWTDASSGGWGDSGGWGERADADVERLWLELGAADDPDAPPEDGDASPADGERRGPYRNGRRHIGRWSHARRTRSAYLSAALVRCGVYLGALSVAVAAAEPLGRVAWPVPAVMVLLGWTAAQALTSMGVTVARRGGPSAAARTVGAGFAAVIGVWCALVWVAPDALLGPDRLLAATAGIGGLVTLATVTAALVTRAESAVAGWYVPCWLLAAAAMADAAGVPEAGLVPVQTLLPAAMVAVAIRAFQPALLPASADRAARRTASRGSRLTASTAGGSRLAGCAGRESRFTTADRRRAFAYLIIGAAQAFSVILLWRGGPAVMPLPAALPLLVAVPLLEGLIGWHTDRIDAGLDAAVTPEEYDRHVRNVTIITLAGLLPPLAAGCGLLVAAYRLPYGFSVVPGARDAVLALAAATLLGGVFAVTFLLAARTRHGIAAALAVIPPLAAAVLALFASPSGLLPAAVAVLAATHLAGLLIVALTAADLRRTP